MTEEKLTEQRNGQNVIVLRENGNRKWSLASAGMVKNSNKYLYGEHADKLAEYEEIGTPEECRAAVEKQKEIRNKAIDDFVERAMKQFTDFDLKHGYPTVTDCKVILRDIAEQMEGSVDNEQID